MYLGREIARRTLDIGARRLLSRSAPAESFDLWAYGVSSWSARLTGLLGSLRSWEEMKFAKKSLSTER